LVACPNRGLISDSSASGSLSVSGWVVDVDASSVVDSLMNADYVGSVAASPSAVEPVVSAPELPQSVSSGEVLDSVGSVSPYWACVRSTIRGRDTVTWELLNDPDDAVSATSLASPRAEPPETLGREAVVAVVT
jgi:hypothetical protein